MSSTDWRRTAWVLCLAASSGLAAPPSARVNVDVIAATGALPAHVTGRFLDPVGFAVAADGRYLVLDRRDHTVYLIDRDGTAVRQILKVGFEPGRLFTPGALSLAGDRFAVSDAPNGYERIQVFSLDGRQVGSFYLDERRRLAPRLTIGPLVVNGVGSMQFTGTTFLVSRPESGGLFEELDFFGRPLREIGVARPTGYESDPNLHFAHNIGIPLVDPSGGFYFVFQTGRPLIRKYDAHGQLVFERHIEGVELDGLIQTLPTTWPLRDTQAGRLPIVAPLVRTAAVDALGRLWVSLMGPFTYVYDRRGEKVRTIQFSAASGTLSPTGLFFSADGRILVTPGCYEFRAPGAWR